MARFGALLDQIAADSFAWEDVSPVLQRRRKPAGGYEYRPNPARGQGAPGVGVVGEDPREKVLREARERLKMSRPETLSETVVEQLKPRVAAGVVSLPEVASGVQGIAEKLNPGMRPRRPGPPGTSPHELLNPRNLYPDDVREVVEAVYAKREAAAQDLARRMTEAGFSPEASAAADTGLELAATTAGDITNVLPGIGLLGATGRLPVGLAPDAALSREASLARQLPETPLAAPRTRGAATLARAMGREEIGEPGASGRRDSVTLDEDGRPHFDWRQQGGAFPPDLDPWIRGNGVDPDGLSVREKLDYYGQLVEEEKAGVEAMHARPREEPARPPLSREEWQRVRNLPASRLAAGNRLVEEGLAKPSEVGALRIGPDPVKADPATEAYRASVFREELARPSIPERIRGAKDRLLVEFASASDPYVARMAKVGAGEEADILAHELRRAGHTALTPITYSTRRWDPAARQWELTGAPLEKLSAQMDEATQRQVEAVMVAQSQVEFAGRYAKAQADYGLARAAKSAERQALRDAGKTNRAAIRGLEAEARQLRAAELRATRATGRATGKAETLSPLASQAQAAGRRADEALRDLVAQATDSEEAAARAAQLLVRERAWRDVQEAGLRAGERRWREAGAQGLPEGNAQRRRISLAVERAAYQSGVSDADLDAAYAALTRGRRTQSAGAREVASLQERVAKAQAERARLEGVRGQAAKAAREKLDEVIRANRAEAQAAVAREKQRAKIARVQRPADLDLDVDTVRAAEAQSYLDQMEAAGELDRLRPHLDALRDFEDRAFLQPLERLGVLSKEAADEIRRTNQHHAVMMIAEDKIGPELRSGEAVSTRTSPVKRREAGLMEGEQYVPTFEAMAIQAARVDKFQVRQLVRNDLAERVMQSPDLWPEMRPAKPGEAGTFVAWKDGKQYAVTAPGELLDVIDNIRPEQTGLVWKAARASAQMLRTLATLAPHFPGMNFLRDQATAAVFSESKKLFGFVPYYEPAKVLFQEIASRMTGKGATRAWKDFQASAAGHSTFLRADREGMARAMEEARLRATPQGRRTLLAREAINPLFVPATVGNALESATRIAERNILLKEGAGAREATRGAAKVSLDFSDGGRFTKKVNEVVAFCNVRFLDPARFMREIRRRPFTIAARATAFITLPALAEEWFHRDDPGYHDLPLWDQAAFYHIGRSTDGFSEGWYKRIPRPLGLVSYLFGLLPQLALRQAIREDPHAAELAVRGLLQDTPAGLMFAQNEQGGTQPSTEWVPTIAKGPMDLVANRKWTGDPVVGDQRAPAREQWTDRTSPLVREMAHAVPEAAPDFLQSPQQLEHLISQQTAGSGRLALDLLNPATRAATGEREPPREPSSPRDVPIVRNFMSAPPIGFESLPAQDLYRFTDRADALADQLRRFEGTDRDRAKDIRARYPKVADAAAAGSAAREQMGIWRKERERIKAQQIPDELKRARLRALDMRVTAYAERQMKEWRKRYPGLLQ